MAATNPYAVGTSHASSLSMKEAREVNPYAVGTSFPSMKEAREAILQHTIQEGLSYKVAKAEISRYILICRSDTCTFRLRVNYNKKHHHAVVTISQPHICSPDTHNNWKSASSVQYLTSNHAASFNVNRSLNPSQIRTTELLHGNHISYKQAWRARKKIEAQVFGEEGESFKKIPSFLN